MSSYVPTLSVIQGLSAGTVKVEGIEYTFNPVTLPNKVRIALKGNDACINLLTMRGTLSADNVETYRAKNLGILKAFATDYYDIDDADKLTFIALSVHVYGSAIVTNAVTDEQFHTNKTVRDYTRLIHGTTTR